MSTTSPPAGNTRRLVAAALSPLLAAAAVLLVIGGAGASQAIARPGCAAAGTAQMLLGVTLSAEQMGNAQTIVSVVAGRRLPVQAAIIAVTTAYAESRLTNSAAETDHDSEGLFQQRVSIYPKAVADDPVNAANAFLDRLIRVPGWDTIPVGDAAQAVQISTPGATFYTPQQAVAAAIVGQLWPAAAAAAPAPTPASATRSVPAAGTAGQPVAICVGGDGAVPLTGEHGNTVAGTTAIPAGLLVTGTAQGVGAARYALQQLGKPYVFGAAGPDAFDCSGLTMAAWASQGVPLPHYTAGPATRDWQVNRGTPEPLDLSQAQAGDLVFIPGADGTTAEPGHVGIVIGHVPTPDGHGRDLYLAQAPGYANLPVELTEATNWLGQIAAVRHLR
jgi:cell wall-associated NlpC family hydrolase